MANPRGSKPKATAEQVIEAVRRNRGIIRGVARDLGVNRTTVYTYVHRWQSVRQALEEERENMIDYAETKLYDQIRNGSLKAIEFFLRGPGKDRGYVERRIYDQHLNGLDLTKLTDEELDQLDEQIANTDRH